MLAISTNFGSVSEDILNRGLPVHLHPVGNVADRVSPIGNPRLEYLPANRERIAAELRGMVERWKAAGQPLDQDVRHPFSVWASGSAASFGSMAIVASWGTTGCGRPWTTRYARVSGSWGSRAPDKWLQAAAWAKNASDLGLVKAVIPPADQDSEAGRARGLGVVLKAHAGETLRRDRDQEADPATGVAARAIRRAARYRCDTAS